MKTNDRLFLTAVIFAGLLARPVFGDTKTDTNLPPLLPPPPVLTEPAAIMPSATAATPAAAAPVKMGPPATNSAAPAKPAKAVKAKTTKSAAKTAKAAPVKKAAPKVPEVSVPLKPGPATVVARRVNVRAQASTKSEVISRLTNGEPVNVIEEIKRENRSSDEPTFWAKIALPASAHGWVSSQFIDATNKTVTVKKLNIRGGPGENYSVLNTLKKGDAITQVGEKAGWLKIEAPSNSIAYVAAAYLKQEIAPTPVEPAPAPTPTPVAEGQVIAAPPTETPVVVATTPAPEPAQAASPAMAAPNLPVILDPSIKREVEREGIVRRTWSIQAPSDYRLVSAETGETVDYLHSTTTNLDLSRYKGLHIIVTGEEGLDFRWKNTPVLTIRRIQPIE